MNGELGAQDLARLHTHFALPLVVSDVLNRIGPLGDDEEYALHLALSEMQPDSALLCIALCCQHIAARYCMEDPDGFALALESERIVDEYGPLWLGHAEGRSAASESVIVSRLGRVPGDFESLIETMEGLEIGLQASDLCAMQMLGVFRTQGEAQSLIAQSYIEALGMAAGLGRTPVRFTGQAIANDNPALVA